MGWIRLAALGDPLMPYEQRVGKALQRIANHTKAITIVDRDALDGVLQQFQREVWAA